MSSLARAAEQPPPFVLSAHGPRVGSLVMELVEGVSLMDHLARLKEQGSQMPEQDIWEVLVAVTMALSYMHNERHVIHRDLTPNNVMLVRIQPNVRPPFGSLHDVGCSGNPPFPPGPSREAAVTAFVGPS